jgi:RNA polymerase sigma-70 factor (ECF subfamily)
MQLQTNNQLKKMLDCLPEDQKEVVLMRLYGNLSFEEIATLTESNINTCLGRMRYALKNLRKHLHDYQIVL